MNDNARSWSSAALAAKLGIRSNRRVSSLLYNVLGVYPEWRWIWNNLLMGQQLSIQTAPSQI